MLEPRLIETDAYDREAFARVMRAVADREELLRRGTALLPHFPALLEDLFAALFKLSIRLRPAAQAPAATLVNRRLLAATLAAPGWPDLKEETALDAVRAGHAAADLARRAIALVRSGEIFLEDELAAAQQLAGEEEALARARAAREDLAPRRPEIAEALRRAEEQARARVQELAGRVRQSVDEVPPRLESEVASLAERLARDLPEFGASSESFARSMGGRGPRSADERLRLAEKLERSDKLRKLAALAGAFRAEARASRRQRRERAATEVFRVGRGAEVARLLPSELVALRRAPLRRDFQRRWLEADLAQYDLRGDDRHGRGPVVVCIDGSGSMAGQRELWAKAVAIALLDVARRQGRRTRAIVFSGREAPLASFELNGRGRLLGFRPVDLQAVVALAECFPSGGTDFEKPLRAAFEAVRGSALKGADVVFITDGEAPVSDAFAEELRREKRKRDTAVFAVIVDDPSRNQAKDDDLASRAARELGKIADQLTTVSELTAGAARGLFRAI